jgi:hypothetical protein
VNSDLDANQSHAPANTPAVSGLLARWTTDDLQTAQVIGSQQLLFAPSPRTICDQMGLSWWAAVKLADEGWLSFSPETTTRLDESQEMELRFLGSLVVAGCDRRMLVALLGGLSKPYAYDLSRLYYDWSAAGWRMLPNPHAHPEAVFTDWLDVLVKSKDVSTLAGVLELTQDALARAKSPAEPDLYDQLQQSR